MKNKLNYIFNILKALVWPIIFMIGQFFINYIFVAIYNSNQKGTMTNQEFLEYINTSSYQEGLNNYINSKSLLIILITMLIFIPLFYSMYKKYKVKNNFNKKNVIIPIILGITISLIYNILIFYLNNFIEFTDNFQVSKLPLIIQIICSGICGPILEELVFRGILYNKLKSFNKKKIAIILCCIIFALFHTDIVNCLYALIVSFILIYLYDKYKSLKAPIIMHVTLNTTIILLLNIIIKNYFIFNLYLVLISIITLIVLKVYLKNNE